MKILAFDTSGTACTVALSENKKLLYGKSIIDEKKHSENIMALIDEGLKNSSFSINDVDLLLCAIGPGSFTGVRIGVSTARGLAHGLGINCICANTLELIAYNLINMDINNTLICPMIDARRDQLYCAAYKFINNVLQVEYAARASSVDNYINDLKQLNCKKIFIGTGVAKSKEIINANLNSSEYSIIEDYPYVSAQSLIKFAINNIQHAKSYNYINPLYLKEPEAVRNKKNARELYR